MPYSIAFRNLESLGRSISGSWISERRGVTSARDASSRSRKRQRRSIAAVLAAGINGRGSTYGERRRCGYGTAARPSFVAHERGSGLSLA